MQDKQYIFQTKMENTNPQLVKKQTPADTTTQQEKPELKKKKLVPGFVISPKLRQGFLSTILNLFK